LLASQPSPNPKKPKRGFFFFGKKVGIGARGVFAAQSDPSKGIRSIAMGIAARGIAARGDAGSGTVTPNLQSLLTILSDVAKAIGAVNTIYKVHRCWDNQDKLKKHKKPDTDEAFEERTRRNLWREHTDWEARPCTILIVKRFWLV
jgi:hypothetical protein